jgi:uncharacterized protein YciI
MQQYLIYAWDGEDEAALNRRMSSRPAHFEGARKLKANGNFIIGGAMLDAKGTMIGSMMVVQFASPEELEQWMQNEPYITGRVWKKTEVYPFRVADV